jgi:hypothetical protein
VGHRHHEKSNPYPLNYLQGWDYVNGLLLMYTPMSTCTIRPLPVMSRHSAISTAHVYARLYAILIYRINSHTVPPAFDGIQMGPTIISIPTGTCSTKVHASDGKNKYHSFLFCITPCIFLQIVHRTTYKLNKMYFMTSIYLLHVSALGCHPQAVALKQEIQAKHSNLGTASPLLEGLKY